MTPVDGDQLLHDLSAVVLRHVVLDHDCAAAAALGIVLTYLVDVVDTLPLLVILSPTKRCGKTRLLTVFQKLVRRAMSSVLVTPATIYRSIEKWHPTLLVDEADNLFKDSHGNDNAELRTVFNSGFTRDHASVPRCVGENMDVKQFSTWAPKVVALTGKLPDTVYDRSIPIKLRRRTKGETIKALRETTAQEWLEFRRRIFRFATDNATQIQNAKPPLPKGLNDRAEDAWSPLLAIAQVAGGDWPMLAAKTAVELSKGAEDQQPIVIQVLASVKEVYEEKGATGPDDFLPSEEIVQELNANPEASWSDWRGGKGISHEKLAASLRRFEVKGVQRQINNKRARGYVFKDLKPVFDRYL